MYEVLKEKFEAFFGKKARYVFSAPGRAELGGNHTDHQLGRVLTCAVSLDTRAAAAENGENLIRVKSEGYPLCRVALNDLSVHGDETGTAAALVRGVAAAFAAGGRGVRGFDAYVTSQVLPGGGLSSSAAFEVLLGTVVNHLSGCGLSRTEIARIGRYAENVYFGKPCGLMDQLASSLGGVAAIDFAGAGEPAVEKLDFDFSASGHALCLIDSGAGHAGLTEEYAAIPGEIGRVCAHFGREYLRQVPEELFYGELPALRREAGDRAVLRAMHVYEENKRVAGQTAALKAGDFPRFLDLVRESGRSSWLYLQNVVPAGNTVRQELAFTLAMAERLLGGRGACRVHGGGFGGTVLAFVPGDGLAAFTEEMERLLGKGACRVLSVRPEGGVLLEEIRR